MELKMNKPRPNPGPAPHFVEAFRMSGKTYSECRETWDLAWEACSKAQQAMVATIDSAGPGVDKIMVAIGAMQMMQAAAEELEQSVIAMAMKEALDG